MPVEPVTTDPLILRFVILVTMLHPTANQPDGSGGLLDSGHPRALENLGRARPGNLSAPLWDSLVWGRFPGSGRGVGKYSDLGLDVGLWVR